jgi:hypothetical protein
MLVYMAATPGHSEAPHRSIYSERLKRFRRVAEFLPPAVWGFVMSVARHPATRVVVLILLTMFQLGLLWLLGQLVEMSLSLMELWLELARKHLEITL